MSSSPAATVYIGRRLIPALPPGCDPVIGDALDAAADEGSLAAADTLVHLVGVPHSSPAKAAQFLSVDLASTRAALAAIRRTRRTPLRKFSFESSPV